MKERLNYIDWLKGIAIIAVVMSHVISFDFFSLTNCSKLFLGRFIGSLQMPLFIFLSGLVVSYKFESIIASSKKLLYKAWILLVPVILIGIPYALWRGFTLYEFIINPMKYGYWYLITLFELYVIYYIAFSYNVLRNTKYEDFIKGCLIWILLKIIAHLHINATLLDAIQFWQLTFYWPFFFVATFINKYKLQDKLFSNNNLFTVSLLIFGGLFIYKEYSSIDNLVMYPLQFAGILCIIYLIYKIKDKNNTILNKLCHIGRNSLDIYILHYFFIHVSYMKIVGNYFLNHPNFILETIVTLIYAIIIVYCSIYTGKLLRESKLISKILFNK